jgi:hypothetical protein
VKSHNKQSHEPQQRAREAHEERTFEEFSHADALISGRYFQWKSTAFFLAKNIIAASVRVLVDFLKEIGASEQGERTPTQRL